MTVFIIIDLYSLFPFWSVIITVSLFYYIVCNEMLELLKFFSRNSVVLKIKVLYSKQSFTLQSLSTVDYKR